MIQFEWGAAEGGYEVEGKKLVPISKHRAKITFPTSDEAEDICLEFANLKCCPEEVREFASRYGLLKSRPLAVEKLSLWYGAIQAMHDVWVAAEEGRMADLPGLFAKGALKYQNIKVLFGPNEDRTGLRLVLNPQNLLSWLWLQLGQTLEGREVRACKECGKFYLAGGGRGGRAKQIRTTRLYCSDRCRMTHNNRHLAERKKLEKREKESGYS